MRTAKAARAAAHPGEASSGKYQALFEQASDAIFTVREDGVIDAANLAASELTGFLKPELIGASVDTLVPDTVRHRVHPRTKLLSRALFASPGTYEDVAVCRKDGFVQFVDLSVRIVQDGGGPRLALALLRDITEKKRMERELIAKHTELRDAYFQLERKNAELQSMQETLVQSGKMAALGELAAGIAHELNQPLQGIRGYSQELLSGELAGRESKEALREIVGSVDKMRSIIDYLRTFTRKSTEKHEFCDVGGVIEESFKMLARQLASRGVTLHKDFGNGVPTVYANPVALEQVFINLATNARDAIEATGRGNGNLWISTRRSGEFAEIEFRDDGCGMTERTKSKAFNPFFTTKEVGRGMGLGLSLSYGILSKIQGSIIAESELGKGTAFVVRVPHDFRETTGGTYEGTRNRS